MTSPFVAPKFYVELVAENRAHFYDVYDKPNGVKSHRFPGVTGFLHVINKPALIGWAQKETLSLVEQALIRKLGTDETSTIQMDRDWITDLMRDAKARPEKIKDDAASLGTNIHAIIDKLIHGEKVTYPEAYAPAVEAFQKWWKESGIELVLGDTKVASLKHGYGGSLDALGRRDGQFIILDWKTSNGIWPEMALQVAAYAQAFYETYGIYIQEGIIVRFGKKLPIDFEARKIGDLERSFAAFLAAKNLKQSLDKPHFLEVIQ
jgi:hypothetical protein